MSPTGTRLPPLSADPERWSESRGVVVRIGDHRVLMLPLAAPTGPSRGRRYEVQWGEDRRTRVVVLNIEGRAAVPPPPGLACRAGEEIAVRLRPVRARRSSRIPEDVRDRLAADVLSAAVVPAAQWAQMLAMVRESSTPDVRAARIEAVASAVRRWNERAGGGGTP